MALSMSDVKNRLRAREALGRCHVAMKKLQRGVEQLASADLARFVEAMELQAENLEHDAEALASMLGDNVVPLPRLETTEGAP